MAKTAGPASRAKTVISSSAVQAQRAHAKVATSRHGHVFAPDPVPAGFHTVIDPNKNPPQPWRDLPSPPGIPPYRMSLDSILDAQTMAGIRAARKLVFHSVGDTGGVNTPSYVEQVARFMEADLTKLAPPDRPSFFYHLGDVVYYDGESANYWPEFYEPYANYAAPIVAIPGNHDGDVNPATGEASLAGFVRNFCSQSAEFSPDNRDAPRRTMTQPNVYWTLLTPLVTIIGAYSNCPEGGKIGPAQEDWLISELKAADKSLPIILAVHHPIYSAYGGHPGNTVLKSLLDDVCSRADRAPDAVLTGHVHDYQRFSAPLHNKPAVPFIVAGAGGYNRRLHMLNKTFHEAKLPVQLGGGPELLEAFNDTQHGYLRVTVTPNQLTLDYIAVPDPEGKQTYDVLAPKDSVTVAFGALGLVRK